MAVHQRIPSAILSEPDAVEAKQVIEDSERYRRIEEMRHNAMLEYLKFEHSEALRKAILRKSRPWRGPVEVGARVAYFRQKSQLDGEGTAEGYRQGIVDRCRPYSDRISLDPKQQRPSCSGR